MSMQWFIKAALHYHARRGGNEQIRAYQKALLPLLNLTIKEAPLLAVDLEMTGLDAQQDQIISIAVMPIEQGQIALKKGQKKLLKITGSVGQSATIHGLHDADLRSALSLGDAMDWLFEQATGRVLIAHHAPLDMRFIEHAVMPAPKMQDHLYAIDTLRIERQRLFRKELILKEGSLRLGACRERYNLPYYAAHDALIDALACAELLLAQVSKMGSIEHIKVQALLR